MKVKLPEVVIDAWKNRDGPVVFTTVDKKGEPNAIYASMVKMMDDGSIAIADNYFKKTKSNIDTQSRGSALFIDKNRKSYQVKGKIEYHVSGTIYEDMLIWADPKHPRNGVALVIPEEVYRGGERLA